MDCAGDSGGVVIDWTGRLVSGLLVLSHGQSRTAVERLAIAIPMKNDHAEARSRIARFYILPILPLLFSLPYCPVCPLHDKKNQA